MTEPVRVGTAGVATATPDGAPARIRPPWPTGDGVGTAGVATATAAGAPARIRPPWPTGDLRVAVTGRPVSPPPPFRSPELPGRERTPGRPRAGRTGLGTAAGMG